MLGVQDESVLVERFADAADPGERVELAMNSLSVGALFGGVPEHDDDTVDRRAVEQG